AARGALVAGDRDAAERAFGRLSELSGASDAGGQTLQDLAREARLTRSSGVAASLDIAADARPAHVGTARAAAGVWAGLGSWNNAVARARKLVEARPDASSSHGVLASILLARASSEGGRPNGAGGDPAAETAFRDAIAALERAAALDPSGVTFPERLMRAWAARGESGNAGRWAAEALERDALSRLDPVAGLSDSSARLARRLVANETGAERTPDGSDGPGG
ncbi:MAG: hypothetical protein AAF235_10180, partial [Planctomycetota bacterium]